MFRTKEQWGPYLSSMPKEGPAIRGLEFLDSGYKTWMALKEYAPMSEISSVLDIGCGHGRMAVPLIDSDTEYLGIDIIPSMIEWADKAFKPWNNIRFQRAPIYNSMYNPSGITPLKFVIPSEIDSFDVVFGLSVFTHIESITAVTRYLQEMRRVLKKHGKCIVTWFTSPPNELSSNARRTVFSKEEILKTIESVKFEVVHSYGGDSINWHDQYVTVLEYA